MAWRVYFKKKKMAQFPGAISKLIAMFERLPGVGPKSATRLVFYLLNTPESYVKEFAVALEEVKSKVKICKECFSVSENEVCDICNKNSRNKDEICVVERAIDVMAIENTGGYEGVYHVLGGVINPLEHVGPDDLKIEELLSRVKNRAASGEVEIILATNPTMEGEATALYIKKQVEAISDKVKISRIGSGLPIGADLEYADASTLSRALESRRSI